MNKRRLLYSGIRLYSIFNHAACNTVKNVKLTAIDGVGVDFGAGQFAYSMPITLLDDKRTNGSRNAGELRNNPCRTNSMRVELNKTYQLGL
jgi:hypothetical protein